MSKTNDCVEVFISPHCIDRALERMRLGWSRETMESWVVAKVEQATQSIPKAFPFSTKPDRPNELNGLRKEILKGKALAFILEEGKKTYAFVVQGNRLSTFYLTNAAWWEAHSI